MRDEPFYEGGNRITVDIRDRVTGNVGAKIGPGPIQTCIDFTGTWLLSQAGTFTARFPANDPRLAYLQLKAHRLNFLLDGVDIFYGIAESWEEEIDNQGQRIAVISGRDELGELAEVPIKFYVPLDEPQFDIPQQLVQLEPDELNGVGWGWFLPGTTETGVYGDFAGETVLSAITRIAERVGESFRLEGSRSLRWLGTDTPSSGVRAVQAVSDPVKAEGNPFICIIQSLTERRNASRFITTIYPTGSGLGETQLDLEGTTRTAPAGFAYDEAANSITSDAAVEELGFRIGRRVNFKEIRPLFNTDADIEYAKDYLFDAAVAYLQRNDSVDDFVEYDLEVAALPMVTQGGNNELGSAVLVGDTIRVIYQDERLNIDTDLVVLGIRTAIDSSGAPRYTLTVATTNQWHLSENNETLAQVEEGQIFTAHPQIDANSYWENFREEVGDDMTNHIAEFPFMLSAEVVTIRQVLFRYSVGRILTGTNSYAYDNANTDQNAASNTGDTAVTTDSTSILIDNATVTTDSTSILIDNATVTTDSTSILIDNATVTVNPLTGGAVSESVVTTTDATSPDSFTETNHLGLATATQGALSSNPTNHSHDIGTHVHDFTHSHTTTTHSHIIDHGHSTNAHSHTNTAHLHTSDAHSHTNTAHLHTSAAHSHTNTAHLHTSAEHHHTSPQHIHGMANLVETFILRRVPVINSYVMADLEYSVNGGTWASLDLGVPVAGGYYELDITSEIQNPNGLRRPLQEDNLVQIRRKSSAGTGKSALIRAKLGIRSTIQSIVSYA